MESGVSPNPCNVHGESLLHKICRTGDPKTLQILLDAGASVQVCDDFGRTPLHDACWRAEPCFEIIEMIVSRDMHLLHMTDVRGATPLSYVHRQHWSRWIEFIDSKKDVWWNAEDAFDDYLICIPELVKIKPNTRPLPDPE